MLHTTSAERTNSPYSDASADELMEELDAYGFEGCIIEGKPCPAARRVEVQQIGFWKKGQLHCSEYQELQSNDQACRCTRYRQFVKNQQS